MNFKENCLRYLGLVADSNLATEKSLKLPPDFELAHDL